MDVRLRTPRPVRGVEVRKLPLSPTEGYVFSLIDGFATIGDVADTTGLAAADVAVIVDKLIELGAAEWPAPPKPRGDLTPDRTTFGVPPTSSTRGSTGGMPSVPRVPSTTQQPAVPRVPSTTQQPAVPRVPPGLTPVRPPSTAGIPAVRPTGPVILRSPSSTGMPRVTVPTPATGARPLPPSVPGPSSANRVSSTGIPRIDPTAPRAPTPPSGTDANLPPTGPMPPRQPTAPVVPRPEPAPTRRIAHPTPSVPTPSITVASTQDASSTMPAPPPPAARPGGAESAPRPTSVRQMPAVPAPPSPPVRPRTSPGFAPPVVSTEPEGADENDRPTMPMPEPTLAMSERMTLENVKAGTLHETVVGHQSPEPAVGTPPAPPSMPPPNPSVRTSRFPKPAADRTTAKGDVEAPKPEGKGRGSKPPRRSSKPPKEPKATRDVTTATGNASAPDSATAPGTAQGERAKSPPPKPPPSAALGTSAVGAGAAGAGAAGAAPAPPASASDEPTAISEADLSLEKRTRIDHLYVSVDLLDHYQVLGLPREADKGKVRSTYFELSKTFHPDTVFRKNVGKYRHKMEVIFKRLTEAYEVLSKKKTREEYDAYLARMDQSQKLEDSLSGQHDMQTLLDAVHRLEAEEASRPKTEVPSAALGPMVPTPPAASPAAASPSPPPAPNAAPRVSTSSVDATARATGATLPRPPGSTSETRATEQRPPDAARAEPAKPAVDAAKPAVDAAKPAVDAAKPSAEQVRRAAVLLTKRLGGAKSSPTPGHPAPDTAPRERRELVRELATSLKHASAITGGVVTDPVQRQVLDGRRDLEKGDLAGALQKFRLAIAMDPSREDVQVEARELERSLARSLASTYEAQALYEEKTNKWASAAQNWVKVCDGRPEDFRAHERAANAIVQSTGDLKLALRLAQRAKEGTPTSALAVRTLARVYVAAGMTLNAKRELEELLQLDPHDAVAQTLLRELTTPRT